MVAIEPVFLINVGLPNGVCQNPQGHDLTPPCPRRWSCRGRGVRGLSNLCSLPHHHHASCLSWSSGASGSNDKAVPHSQAQGPASLSKDGVQLLGDIMLLGVLQLQASTHHHIGVCFATGVCRSQVASLRGQNGGGLRSVTVTTPGYPCWT